MLLHLHLLGVGVPVRQSVRVAVHHKIVFVEGTRMLANLGQSGQKKAAFLLRRELLQVRQRWGDLGQRVSSDFHASDYIATSACR